MYKFLIIQTAFTGDVVLATSIVEKLHATYPDAQIDFLLRKGNEGLFTDHPFIKNVLVWDKKGGKYRNLVKMIMRVRKEKYTHIINPHRFMTSGLIMLFAGTGYTSGFDKNPLSFFFTKSVPHIISPTGAEHPILEVQRYQLLIEELTDKNVAQPKLYPSRQAYEKVMPYQGEPYITMAPSSVWFTKRFPAEKWSQLIDALPPQYKILIIGAPGDKALGDEVMAGASNKNTENLCGHLNYLESCALIEKAVMNYSNDSAPLHFAVATDAPVTGIFCSTVSAFGFGPVHAKGKVVELDHPLYCRPCGLHGRKECPEGHFKCAWEIKNEQLLWWTSKTI